MLSVLLWISAALPLVSPAVIRYHIGSESLTERMRICLYSRNETECPDSKRPYTYYVGHGICLRTYGKCQTDNSFWDAEQCEKFCKDLPGDQPCSPPATVLPMDCRYHVMQISRYDCPEYYIDCPMRVPTEATCKPLNKDSFDAESYILLDENGCQYRIVDGLGKVEAKASA